MASKRQRRWIEITTEYREALAVHVAAMIKNPISTSDAAMLSNALINAYWMEQNARMTDANLKREQQRQYYESE